MSVCLSLCLSVSLCICLSFLLHLPPFSFFLLCFFLFSALFCYFTLQESVLRAFCLAGHFPFHLPGLQGKGETSFKEKSIPLYPGCSPA